MSTTRSGYVRTTTDAVYKGTDAAAGKKIEYDFSFRDSSCLVIFVGLLLIAGIAYFILTHI